MTDTVTPIGTAPPEAPITPEVLPPPSRKSYRAARDAVRSTPFPFDIDGEVFTSRPGRVPGSVTIDFVGVLASQNFEALWNYFRCAFVDERGKPIEGEYDRFRAYLDDPSREVDELLLFEIVKDMVEFAAGLPTVQSSS